MEFSQVILPHDLCADYGIRSLSFSVGVSAAVVAFVVAGQLVLAFRQPLFAFGSVLFWAGLLPVANIVPIFRPMADRFLYVPLLGIAMMVAQGLFLARKLRPEPHTSLYFTLYAALFVWISAAAVVTFRREAVWHDSLALWQDTAAGNPASDTAANNLGWVLLAAHREQEAAASFQRAVRLTGAAEADPWAGLALASEAAGQPGAADAAYRRAVALDARYAHPRELVRALVADSENAGKLEVLAQRNTKP
jgi:tetratricopeptide (TPR) repeat protein